MTHKNNSSYGEETRARIACRRWMRGGEKTIRRPDDRTRSGWFAPRVDDAARARETMRGGIGGGARRKGASESGAGVLTGVVSSIEKRMCVVSARALEWRGAGDGTTVRLLQLAVRVTFVLLEKVSFILLRRAPRAIQRAAREDLRRSRASNASRERPRARPRFPTRRRPAERSPRLPRSGTKIIVFP